MLLRLSQRVPLYFELVLYITQDESAALLSIELNSEYRKFKSGCNSCIHEFAVRKRIGSAQAKDPLLCIPLLLLLVLRVVRGQLKPAHSPSLMRAAARPVPSLSRKARQVVIPG